MTDKVSVTQALKPCPFCGFEQLTSPNFDEHLDAYTVLCETCVGEGPTAPSATKAIRAWNDRAATPAERTLLTLVDTMREYLPPDGISKDEFINRVLGVLDNDEMAKLIGELEGRK